MASKHMFPKVTKQWNSMATELQQQRHHLRELFKLHIQLHLARAQQEQLDRAQDRHAPVPDTQDSQLVKLQSWEIAHPQALVPARVDGTTRSVLGPWLSKCFMDWAVQLKWPADGDTDPMDPGVTFMELAASFMITMGTYLPIRREALDGVPHYYLPTSFVDATARGVTLAEYGFFMAYIMHQMNQLRIPGLFPIQKPTVAKSLYWLGAKQMAKGFKRRPWFPQQHAVMEQLACLARLHGYHMAQHTLEVSVTIPVDRVKEELQDSIQFRQERVKREIPKLRRMAGIR
eukprot:Skav226988  [mRNA]  locus=scaffold2341:234107:234970:- [translate_table: standard]